MVANYQSTNSVANDILVGGPLLVLIDYAAAYGKYFRFLSMLLHPFPPSLQRLALVVTEISEELFFIIFSSVTFGSPVRSP